MRERDTGKKKPRNGIRETKEQEIRNKNNWKKGEIKEEQEVQQLERKVEEEED
jgi:hypothetical protein